MQHGPWIRQNLTWKTPNGQPKCWIRANLPVVFPPRKNDVWVSLLETRPNPTLMLACCSLFRGLVSNPNARRYVVGWGRGEGGGGGRTRTHARTCTHTHDFFFYAKHTHTHARTHARTHSHTPSHTSTHTHTRDTCVSCVTVINSKHQLNRHT